MTTLLILNFVHVIQKQKLKLKYKYNPVENSYHALWEEYKEIKSPIPLKNVRKILNMYFLQLCSYSKKKCSKSIIKFY